MEKKNPDRTAITDRRVIADMRRINVGFSVSQYYPVMVPSIESIARLLVSMTVTLPGFEIEMAKSDIASAFRLLRLRPSLSLLMCTELPGGALGHTPDVALFYLVMSFGWNGSPANFAILGDAISCVHAQFGMGCPHWFLSIPILSKLYVDDELLFDIRNKIRQQANVLTWEAITTGLLGTKALILTKLEEEGQRSATHTMLGFDINSSTLKISLPDAKVAGDRALFEQLVDRRGSRALEVVIPQRVRGHIEHFRASNAICKFPTGPIDLMLRYTDEQAACVNCPVPEVWDSFRNGMSAVFDLMRSESQWREIFHGNLIRLLTPGQRLSVRLGRISPRFIPGRFAWVSVAATWELMGGVSRGGREFFRTPTSRALPHFRPPVTGGPIIGECELTAAIMAIATWAVMGSRYVALRTDNRHVLSWCEHARAHSAVSNRILKSINRFLSLWCGCTACLCDE